MQLPEAQSAWETSGVFHIWQQKTGEDFPDHLSCAGIDGWFLCLLTTDIAIGRKTGKSAIYAYESMRKKWKFLGVITFLVPVLIMTYYAVIGGWILRYIVIYLTSSGKQAVADDCFTAFISSPSSVWYGLIFMLLTALIVYNGVEDGIERVSKFIMPVLLIMVIGIAIFSLTLRLRWMMEGTYRIAGA